jgi:hypothetical protein
MKRNTDIPAELAKRSRITLSLTASLLVAILVVGVWECQFSLRIPEVREFPYDFHGYAIIVWSIPGYPALPIRNGKLLESFAAGRVIITSTPPHYGYAWDENYFIRPDGSRITVAEKDFFGATGSAQGHGSSIFLTTFSIRIDPNSSVASTEFRESQDKIQELLEKLTQGK